MDLYAELHHVTGRPPPGQLHKLADTIAKHGQPTALARHGIVSGESFSGLPIVPFDSVAVTFPPAKNKMFIAIGYSKMNRVRSHFYAQARFRGYELITFIGSKVLRLDSDVVGDNCCIFDGATLAPFASLADDVIVWGGVHVGHHSSIGAHTFLAPQVALRVIPLSGAIAFLVSIPPLAIT